MTKRVGMQCEAAEHKDLSREEGFSLDDAITDDLRGHRILCRWHHHPNHPILISPHRPDVARHLSSLSPRLPCPCPSAIGDCRCQNRQISGRGSRTVGLRIEGNRRQGHDVYPGSGPLDGGNTLRPAWLTLMSLGVTRVDLP